MHPVGINNVPQELKRHTMAESRRRHAFFLQVAAAGDGVDLPSRGTFVGTVISTDTRERAQLALFTPRSTPYHP